VLAIVHLPNAALWGAVAALLNFIPYVGTVVSTVLIGAAALLTFDGVEKTVIVLIAYSAIHVISGYIVTPIWLGRRLPLNQVALFLGLVFWTWVWGAAGAILAVPLTVMAKVVCDHVPRLRPMAVLLDN
jgi:predicted PurR-regulated permease PerM